MFSEEFSEETLALETNHGVVVGTKWLIHIVRVAAVSGESLLWSGGFSLGEDLSAGGLVPLEHLDGIDMVDLNVMGGETVVEEVGWEHHVVSSIPELWLVLQVESEHISLSDKSKSV